MANSFASQPKSADSIAALLSTAAKSLMSVSETAQLDAEVLLCHSLGKSRSFLRAWPELQPSHSQRQQFLELITLRRQGMPIAYLTGNKEFWSRQFTVSADVLIPRPDSELLIELSLQRLASNRAFKILDLGTGSGILAITLAAERPLCQVWATDLSPAALAIAQENARQLGVANVRFLQSHWLDTIDDDDFDLIVSNPPYIAAGDPHLNQGDLRFEPISALISPENGLHDIRLIAEQARQHLKNNGQLLVEHGYNQSTEVQSLFTNLNYQQVTTHTDLAGNPRVTSGIWCPTL